MDAQQQHVCVECSKNELRTKKCPTTYVKKITNFLKFSSIEGIMREERTNTREERTDMRQRGNNLNEFVAVVTFSRQYILTGSYSHAMFYVARVLL